ncbi:MAG TPA: hypothetical protein VMS09_00310 [Paenibacillus sp.]|uniref:hypothetical protein n=1 Tax=Paenibacillus sp. TaxID=58172 RepID=UPI002CD87801|nr:hypothetical protein [Paenibacillus sp.]HUC90451.1 hypothetical protein [Paenibacillus sp.]
MQNQPNMSPGTMQNPVQAANAMQMPGGMPSQLQGAQQPSTQQMSYDQFKDQVRQRQEQQERLARQALVSAGADRQSDRIRSLLQDVQSIGQEVQMAENQVQVQMNAQLRQLQLIQQRLKQIESAVQAALPQNQNRMPLQ